MRKIPLIGILLSILAVSANAGLVRVTPLGVAPPDQDITSPVPIYDDGFRLTFQGNGNKELIDPILLILGTPADVAGGDSSAPTLTFGSSSKAFSNLGLTLGADAWGANTTGSAGIFDADSSVNDVYEFIGVDSPNSGGSDSNNYTNWSGAAVQGADSWEIFVFELTFDPDVFAQGDWVELLAPPPRLQLDTFVAGYGCLGETSTGGCDKLQATPFTFSGHVTQVPAPATLVLALFGLLGLLLSSGPRRVLMS